MGFCRADGARRWAVFILLGVTLWAAARAEGEVALTGSFAPTVIKKSGAPGLRWDSWQRDDANHGSFQRRSLTVERRLSLEVAGFPGSEGVDLWLENEEGRRLPLQVRAHPALEWAKFYWTLPPEWRHREVTLNAEDHSAAPGGWLGVGIPAETSILASLAQVASVVVSYTFVVGLLLAPGIAVAFPLARRNSWRPAETITAVLVASGLFGYLSFFVYLASSRLGQAASWITVLAASAAALWQIYISRHHLWFRKVLWPMVISWSVGLVYIAAVFLFGGSEFPNGISLGRVMAYLPVDPLIPHWLAERLATGVSIKPFFSDWLSSDRPPLQAGFNLLLWPLIPKQLGYYCLGVSLQLWMFLGAWVLLESAGLLRRTWLLFIIGAVFSGFCYTNSVFVWPKLLPAAYLLCAYGLIFFPKKRESVATPSALLAAASAALATLGHGGSAFALIGLALVWLLARRNLRPTTVVLAGAVACLILLPWSAYKRFYDPPGNRLTKYHIGGVSPIDGRSSFQTIIDSYRSAGSSEILRQKRTNAALLFGDHSDLLRNLTSGTALLLHGKFAEGAARMREAIKTGAFFHLIQSPGIFLFGALGLWGTLRRPATDETARFIKISLMLLGVTLVVWCLLMFGGSESQSVLHQGSYFAPLLLLLILAVALSALPRVLQISVCGLQGVLFIVVWPPPPPGEGRLLPGIDYGFMTLGIISLVLLCVLALASHRWLNREDKPEIAPTDAPAR